MDAASNVMGRSRGSGSVEKIDIFIYSVALNKTYISNVEQCISTGEFIRNSCVNMGIDPDTIHGVTVNVKVLIDGVEWKYDPFKSLRHCGLINKCRIQIEPCDAVS